MVKEPDEDLNMRRKLLFIVAAIGFGMFMAITSSTPIFLVMLMLMSAIFYINRNVPFLTRRIAFLLMIFSIFGFIRMSYAVDNYNIAIEKEDFSSHYTKAEVYKITEEKEGSLKLFVIINEQDGKAVKKKALINYYKKPLNWGNLCGSKIACYCRLTMPTERRNPYCFDYRKHLRSQGIYFVSETEELELLKEKKSILGASESFIIQKKVSFLMQLNCSDEIKGFINGLIFGDKSGMAEDIYEDFRNNGTAHILAVSGLHIGILYGLYTFILSIKKTIFVTVGFIVFLLFYGTLTLWSISVTRAVIMVMILTIGELTNRRYDLLTALALVAGAALFYNPFMIENTGFQMSFLAVISIGFIGPFLSKWMPKSIAMLFAVQIGIAPYSAYVFNYIPLISILCNIPIIYITTLVVPLGLFCFFTFLVFGNTFFDEILSSVADLLIEINRFLAADVFFAIDVISMPLGILVAIYLLGFFLISELFQVCVLRWEWKTIIAYLVMISMMVGASASFSVTPFDKAIAIFVDVGQGDCLHIKAPNRQNFIIDGGGSDNYNLGKKTVKPYLLKNGVKRIDIALATHLHTDHYKGISELNECFDISKIITTGKAGDVIEIKDNIKIKVLWPIHYKKTEEDENLNSLIFKVNFENLSILVTGDITEEGENMLLNYYEHTDELDADILKVAHHGSKYSSSDAFIDAVSPSVAVISVGKNNYGHPSNEVIAKLVKKDIIVVRTDQSGAVGIIKDKDNIKICTEIKNKREALKSSQKN